MPRSTSVTVTLAPTTRAPLGSRTRPTMAPVSFCAHSGQESAIKRTITRAERICRRANDRGMANLLDARPELPPLDRFRTGEVRESMRLLSVLYYEHLLLLSFCSFCQSPS